MTPTRGSHIREQHRCRLVTSAATARLPTDLGIFFSFCLFLALAMCGVRTASCAVIPKAVFQKCVPPLSLPLPFDN